MKPRTFLTMKSVALAGGFLLFIFLFSAFRLPPSAYPMSDFHEKFLHEGRGSWLGRFTGGGTPKAPRSFFGAFGKHPGWNDHLDDIGLETDSLVLAKQSLYVEGIGGQLNSGAWEKIYWEDKFPAFEHILLWRRWGQTLVGRMWSSSDGKKRGLYPMVVCAQVEGAPLGWTLRQVLPQLDALESSCRATDVATDVIALLGLERNRLRRAVGALPGMDEAALSSAETPPAPLPAFEDESLSAEATESALRFLYCLHSQCADYAPGGAGSHGKTNPRELRVTAGVESQDVTLWRWCALLETLLDPATPLLLLLPLSGDWLDVVLGEPVPASFFCLRAMPAALPPVNTVAYTFDEKFRQCALPLLAGGADAKAVKAFWKTS